MNMTFWWQGKDNDAITLQDIRLIPGMRGVVGLYLIFQLGKPGRQIRFWR